MSAYLQTVAGSPWGKVSVGMPDGWDSTSNQRSGVADSPEHSLVTILAVDTVRSTEHIANLDPDDAERFLDDVLAFVRSNIEASGGVLASFHGDGGLAIFGWPDSLEDHADRACEAAWSIQHPQKPLVAGLGGGGMPLNFRIGIHSGLVRFRQLRLGVGSNLDLVGATVHMAAALQKQAPQSGILISTKTRELCRWRLDLQHRADVELSTRLGNDAYELIGQPKPAAEANLSTAYSLPMVGRSFEKSTLWEALHAETELSRTIAAIGEPGIGKSRLAAAIVDDWRQSGGNALVLRADTRQSTTPYSAMKTLLSASIDRIASPVGLTVDDLDAAGVAEDEIRRLTPILAGAEARNGIRNSAQTSRQIARAFVGAFTKSTLDRRILVLIDDLQSVDPESIECLSVLVNEKSCRHIALLLTGRPEAEAVARRITPQILQLAPMESGDMEALAARLCPELTEKPTVMAGALSQADGVPFVLEQLLLSVDPTSVEADISLPQPVESLIHGRLNKLTGDAKALAQVASLLGEETDLDLVAGVLECEAGQLVPRLEELEQLGLLHRQPDKRLRFRHGIIAEATATTVPRERRRRLHLKAIDAISSTYANLNEHYERIAFHAMGADDAENALEYLWLAGLQARRSSARGSLQLIFERVEECVERLGDEADERYVDFVLMSCAALVQVGEISRMKKHLQRALMIARNQDQQENICGALCHLGMLCWFEGRYDEGLRVNREALTLAGEMESLPHRFAAQLSLASNHHGLGQMDQAIDLMEELCDLLGGDLIAARLGATGLPSAMSYAFRGWFLVDVGRYPEALQHARRALAIASEYNDIYGGILARNSLARVLLALRRHDEARQCVAVAHDMAEREGYHAILPHVCGRLATAMARTGDAESAVRMVDALLGNMAEVRTGRLEMFNLFAGYAEALFRTGEADRAFEMIDRALTIARSLDNPPLLVQALSLLVWMTRGDDRDGWERNPAEELARLCESHGLVARVPDEDSD